MDTEKPLMDRWADIEWKKIERNVWKLQARIYRAEQRGDVKTVRKLQKLLMKSRSAKLLAVRKVTQENQGKKTAGIDGIKSLSPVERLNLSQRLRLNQAAQPIRRVWIPKPGSDEKRPLGILVMADRALQAVVKLALEPEWEARFEANSYGFRPGRSAWDAIEAIFKNISGKPKWCLDADIAKCFDRINHTALLNKINTSPSVRRQIHAWLKAGVMDNGEFSPTSEGVAQGGPLSPLLTNITLHGLETTLRTTFKTQGISPPVVIRYADDLVVLHPERAVVERCQIIISEWLTGFGLELKPGKTRLVHTLHKNESGLVGFDFLGFQIRQYAVGKTKSARSSNGKPLGFKTIIKPSQEAIRRHYLKIRDTINQHLMANQTTLIQRLNPIIRGWSKYYSTVCSRQSYRRLDQCLFVKLRAWAIRRHPTKSGGWRYKRYWHQTEGRIRFSTPDWSHRLSFYEDRLIRRHIKVQGPRSPFDGNWVYWSTRLGSHPEASIRVGKLLKKQRGKCLSCGLYFKDGDRLEIDHIIPKRMNGKDAYYNWQLLHRHCHDQKTAGEAVPVCPDKHQIS